ncbi:MAG: sporulation protein YunB [Bacilli bacterium]|nr:sporulation protein YunB [Bacilli bacterium]
MRIRKIYFTLLDKIIILTISVFLLTYLMIKLFTIKSEKILLDYAQNKSMQLSSILINNAIYEITYNNNYESFMKTNINKDNMLDIELDNKKANEILFQINDNILRNINNIEKGNFTIFSDKYLDDNLIFSVPIGVIYDIPILVGIGPKIPFKLDIIANTNNSIYTNIKEYGINNSIIEVILKINLNIQIILPFSSKEVNVSKDIPIDTKIIEGKVPTYYGGLIKNSN